VLAIRSRLLTIVFTQTSKQFIFLNFYAPNFTSGEISILAVTKCIVQN